MTLLFWGACLPCPLTSARKPAALFLDMKRIANHQNLCLAKSRLRYLWQTGDVRPPDALLKVPVLSTSNRDKPLLGEVMAHDPLFFMDRRPEKQWSWWLKIKSLEEFVKLCEIRGFSYFLYVDSDDSFIWRSFTEEDCKKFLDGKVVRFQGNSMCYPPNRELSKKLQHIHGTEHRGVCAGCFIAKVEGFQDLIDKIKELKEEGCSDIFNAKNGEFDDQAAWNTLACLMPESVGVQAALEVLSYLVPSKMIWEGFKSRGVGDSIKKLTSKLKVPHCGGCDRRQKKLNRLLPYGQGA